MDCAPKVYRCSCGKLLRKLDILKGICVGHQIKFASTGSLFEWLKIKYWSWKGDI